MEIEKIIEVIQKGEAEPLQKKQAEGLLVPRRIINLLYVRKGVAYKSGSGDRIATDYWKISSSWNAALVAAWKEAKYGGN